MSARSYLSIGDVLTLLRQEFPDVTISKIRFLESQGLVNPERTPSGYRKFYEHDVERLRWVLRQQREHFLPLKVIKDRLDEETAKPAPKGGTHRAKASAGPPAVDDAPTADEPDLSSPARAEEPVLVGQRTGAAGDRPAVSAHTAAGSGGDGPVLLDVGPPEGATASEAGSTGPATTTDRPGRPAAAPTNGGNGSGPVAARPVERTGPSTPATSSPTSGGSGPAAGTSGLPSPDRNPASSPAATPPVASGPKETAAPRPSASRPTPSGKTPPPAAPPPPPTSAASGGASLSADELAAASGLDLAVLRELEEYGLLHPTNVAGVEIFDEESLAVATLAAGFAKFGVEPRHLRLYKNAADREAGFVEQIVLPLVRQRNPDARARAHETADELAALGQQLRGSLLRSALGDLLNS